MGKPCKMKQNKTIILAKLWLKNYSLPVTQGTVRRALFLLSVLMCVKHWALALLFLLPGFALLTLSSSIVSAPLSSSQRTQAIALSFHSYLAFFCHIEITTP